jgi:hypothetical protein
MGLDEDQVMAAVTTMRTVRRCPSPERMAVIVMNDPGLDDEDIAEMFGRSERWARMVRSQAEDIRRDEPLGEALYPWMYPSDPTHQELERRQDEARELYAAGLLTKTRVDFFASRRALLANGVQVSGGQRQDDCGVEGSGPSSDAGDCETEGQASQYMG